MKNGFDARAAKPPEIAARPSDCSHFRRGDVQTHHNQAATLASNKNASKAVRDKLKAQQAAAAIVDAAKQGKMVKEFTKKQAGPSSNPG